MLLFRTDSVSFFNYAGNEIKSLQHTILENKSYKKTPAEAIPFATLLRGAVTVGGNRARKKKEEEDASESSHSPSAADGRQVGRPGQTNGSKQITTQKEERGMGFTKVRKEKNQLWQCTVHFQTEDIFKQVQMYLQTLTNPIPPRPDPFFVESQPRRERGAGD